MPLKFCKNREPSMSYFSGLNAVLAENRKCEVPSPQLISVFPLLFRAF